MTPTAVGLVLVEGEDADGEIMDQDGFDVPTRRGAAAISTSDYVAGAMSRTRAMADGRRPHAIGVTWSEESAPEGSPAPEFVPPPLAPGAPPPTVSEAKPPLLTRILSHIPGLHDDPAPPSPSRRRRLPHPDSASAVGAEHRHMSATTSRYAMIRTSSTGPACPAWCCATWLQTASR